jgi:uncharacterized membrane protein
MRHAVLRHAILIVPALALLALSTGPAEAVLNVCNKTALSTRVALGRFDGTSWTSQGWWMLKPGDCAGLLTGPLNARYYYLYATDGAGGTWEGKTHFCVAPQAKFLAPGRADCGKRGFEQRGFFEVDTGAAPDWTQTLSN